MLTRTTTPHSIHPSASTVMGGEFELLAETPSPQVIVHPADIPETPLYRRPDLRQIEKQIEKLFTFGIEANRLENLKASHDFTLPMSPGNEQAFTLTLELRRAGGILRGTIRVRLSPRQLTIDFPQGSAP